METNKLTAEELFLKKYGNKITASESWVIRFAEEFAELKTTGIKTEISTCECGRQYPLEYYSADDEGCEYCPKCLREVYEEEIERINSALKAAKSLFENQEKEIQFLRGQRSELKQAFNDLYMQLISLKSK